MKQKPKIGDVVLNKFHENELVKKHPIVQISETEAVILTSKYSNDRLKLDSEYFSDFSIKSDCFVSKTIVRNDSGKVVGKVKKQYLKIVLSFVLISILTFIIFIL